LINDYQKAIIDLTYAIIIHPSYESFIARSAMYKKLAEQAINYSERIEYENRARSDAASAREMSARE
jgi:hypothetical protein